MNSLWIDIKYANIIGSRMDRFTIRDSSKYKAQFRCPYCGDSKKNKNKARGWLFLDKNTIYYKCFNCQKSAHLSTFISDFDKNLYSEYRLENFQESTEFELPIKEKKVYETSFKGLIKLSDLDSDHPAKKYLLSRKLPIEHFDKIYYTDTFFTWVNTIIPEKFSLKFDEPRIVFPFFMNGKLVGVNARVMPTSTNTSRYITIKFDESAPKIYGLGRVDLSKTYFVVEGPIDSLFLSNAIAMIGTDTNLEQFVHKDNAILVFDNECRNKEVLNQYNKYIQSGWNICIWPSNIKEKDINDLILSGKTSPEIESFILQNTHRGLQAQLLFNAWRKR